MFREFILLRVILLCNLKVGFWVVFIEFEVEPVLVEELGNLCGGQLTVVIHDGVRTTTRSYNNITQPTVLIYDGVRTTTLAPPCIRP